MTTAAAWYGRDTTESNHRTDHETTVEQTAAVNEEEDRAVALLDTTMLSNPERIPEPLSAFEDGGRRA